MEWFQELYDDFRQRTGFGSLPEERTRRDVDFIVAECDLEGGRRVLDLCSGTGRHSIELARRGIRSVGIELNAEYVALARTRADAAGVRPELRVGDVRSSELGSDYDAAILMWNSFGYFSDAEDLALLRRISSALRPRGRFLLELLNRDWILRNFEARSEREVDGVTVVEERKFDAGTNRMKARIRRSGDDSAERRVDWRLYSLPELATLGRSVGFELAAAYGDLKRSPVTLESRLMRLVFERAGDQPVAD